MRRRRRRRRRRRNSWRGAKRRHRLAALKGARRKRRRGGRRRARNSRFRYRRRRGRARRRGGRRRRRNPFAITKSITAGFQPKILTKAATITGGALGNAWFSGMVSGFLPGMLQSGVGNYVVGLGTAGVLGAGVGMVAPRMAGDVFLGGVLEVVTRAVKEYVLPVLPGMSGFVGDYATPEDAATARSLGGVGDYFERGTPLRPLGDYYGDETVADELVA